MLVEVFQLLILTNKSVFAFGKNDKPDLVLTILIKIIITMNLPHLEKRILETKISIDRQLNLIGKPGYDPALTINLKKDIAWLQEQNKSGFILPFSPMEAIS